MADVHDRSAAPDPGGNSAARSAVPRAALRCPGEAADALGVSPDFFDEHVRPELRLIRRGRIVLVSLRELDRWLERSSARVLEGFG
jgi:hypothetical protein